MNIPAQMPTYIPGEPCADPGCLSHATKPCAGCGRIGGRPVEPRVLGIPAQMFDIATQLRTQDNACTADPFFVVYSRRKNAGIDERFGHPIMWVNSSDEESYVEGERRFKALERYHDRYFQEPEGWTRTGYVVVQEFVTVCLTRVAAEEYIRRNRHNLSDPYIDVESFYRNPEMKMLRAFLESLTTATPAEEFSHVR